ncbi:MAG: type I phosphomannose isomerase catalytic subunit [Erysipelotrichaceae bacterium]|nr:type I phosphomannose isomerase catalytic subunit [Erysipelotrichaceae bacterium]
MITNIFKLTPVLKDHLWGGHNLAFGFNKANSPIRISESWEVSVHKAGISKIDGIDLDRFLINDPTFLGTANDKLNIMVKFIDAKKALSIQVHPDDAYAIAHENDSGKIEMWVIMDAKPNSYIYYGLKADLDRSTLQQLIKDNTITDHLNKVPVSIGDVFIVYPTLIHAIGEDITICEIQQSSNVTYRLYDYDRTDDAGNKRELHIEKALDVCNTKATVKLKHEPIVLCDNNDHKSELLFSCEHFTTKRYDVKNEITLTLTKETYTCLIMLKGVAEIDDEENTMTIKQGESYLIRAIDGQITLKGECLFLTVTQ